MHTMTDRLGDIGDKFRERRTTSKIDHLDDENHRLRTELNSMQSTLERERADRLEILDALKGKPKTVVKKKRGGLLRMAVIGGGAYVLGSRAGRERYEQIVDWAKQMKDRGQAKDDYRTDVMAAGDTRPGETMTSTGGFGSAGSGTSGTATSGSATPAKNETGKNSTPKSGTSGA